MWQGIVLPRIDQSIPVVFNEDSNGLLAQFIRGCAAARINYPEGDFLSLSGVLQAMWEQHIKKKLPTENGILAKGVPCFEVTDEDSIRLIIESHPYLNTFKLKPVVESLEAEGNGLGWFVWDSLMSASHKGHEIYSDDMILSRYLYEMDDLEEFSDKAYAMFLTEIHEINDPIDYSDEFEVKRVLDSYGRYSPSTLLKLVDGHEHLLGRGRFDQSRVASVKTVRAWIKANKDHELSKPLLAALNLTQGLQRPGSGSFVWEYEQMESSPLGAAAFVTWSDPCVLREALSEFEQMEYQGGEAREAYASLTITPEIISDKCQLGKAIRSIMTYFDNWGRLEILLSTLPLVEENENV